MISDRVERERRFHDDRFSDGGDPRQHLNKWYAGVRHGAENQQRFVLSRALGADVLEYGCADGVLSLHHFKLPQVCRSLTGIDISEVAVAKAIAERDRARLSNADFLAMNAEAMTFPDDSFDLVFGRGILHHLDLSKCLPEIARVLRPGGAAIFFEPLGHNPILNLYRRRTPDLRSEDERPLRMADLAAIGRCFRRVETEFCGLFSAASVLVDPSAAGIPYKIAKAIDDLILPLPGVKRYAWHCLIICHA